MAGIPWYVATTTSLSSHLSVEVYFASMPCLLEVVLQWTLDTGVFSVLFSVYMPSISIAGSYGSFNPSF